MSGFQSRPPASINSTRAAASSLSRLASTQPAEPAPTITSSAFIRGSPEIALRLPCRDRRRHGRADSGAHGTCRPLTTAHPRPPWREHRQTIADISTPAPSPPAPPAGIMRGDPARPARAPANCPALAFGADAGAEHFAQPELLDLAGRRARQFLRPREPDMRRHLVGGEPRAAARQQLFGVQLRPRAQHDGAGDDLLLMRVRHADRMRLADLRKFREKFFDLARRHQDAARLEHFLAAGVKVEIAGAI